MARIRDILTHVSVETAIRRRKCHRSSAHSVRAGGQFLSIRETQTLGSKNYCARYARDILQVAEGRLADLRRVFG